MNAYSKVVEVRWADMDASQHMRHSAYADYATHVRVEWLRENGFDAVKLAELRVMPVIFSDNTEYFKELRMSDRVRIDLELVGLSEDASRYHLRQRFVRDDVVCARYEIKGGWLDVVRRKLGTPPPGIVEATQNLKRTSDYAVLPAVKLMASAG
ncbi:MAG TPA: thioesterase family protein [Myxococcaceae bacterium]|nr:thioesterase family protein [Myxococcaceae bacterium]